MCSSLLNNQEGMKVELSNLNKELLTNLAQSRGNILENRDLLTSLDSTKAAALDIAAALKASKELQAELDQQRNCYLAVALQAACVYFVLVDLQALNHMYRFSLAMYLQLFRTALSTSARSLDISVRIAAINGVCIVYRKALESTALVLTRPCAVMHPWHAFRGFATGNGNGEDQAVPLSGCAVIRPRGSCFVGYAVQKLEEHTQQVWWPLSCCASHNRGSETKPSHGMIQPYLWCCRLSSGPCSHARQGPSSTRTVSLLRFTLLTVWQQQRRLLPIQLSLP
jgi:hypothetical protein